MYGNNSFSIEEIMGDKALEFKCKFYKMKYIKDETAEIANKEKGKYTRSIKAIRKILNGKPITDLKEYNSIRTIKLEE